MKISIVICLLIPTILMGQNRKKAERSYAKAVEFYQQNTNKKAKDLFSKVSELFVQDKGGNKTNSKYLAPDFNYKEVQLGHSYFILKDGDESQQLDELKMRLQYEIMPILKEYVKDGLLLESDKLSNKLTEIENFEL